MGEFMRFAKSIFCDNMKIEVTANTETVIDTAKDKVDLEKRLKKFDIDEFIGLYGHIPDIAVIISRIRPVTEILFQVEFWESFCHVLTKSAHLGFLGCEYSECLKKACKRVLPRTQSYTYYTTESSDSPRDYNIDTGKFECTVKHTSNLSYSDCRNIVLKDNNYVAADAEYGGRLFGQMFSIQLKYPLDYLRLLKSVEYYIEEKSAPRKVPFQKENKSPTLYRADQMIKDFLQSHKEEINQFQRYAMKYEEKENLIEKVKSIYNDLLLEESLIVDGKGFPKKYCGFDIYKKKDEIDTVIKKLNNSIDEGEDEVEYAIRWLCAESSVSFKIIKKNCESKYRYGCIILKNSSFIDDVQEYDHILVSEAGVILIETKHWKGRVEVRSDGKWVRDPNNDGCIKGIESPMYQIQRHEALIKSILPNVPIHSLLVFSNSSLILEGVENCKMCHVIYVDKLKETIMQFFSTAKPISINIVNYWADEIEKHKVNIMQDDIRELKR